MRIYVKRRPVFVTHLIYILIGMYTVLKQYYYVVLIGRRRSVLTDTYQFQK